MNQNIIYLLLIVLVIVIVIALTTNRKSQEVTDCFKKIYETTVDELNGQSISLGGISKIKNASKNQKKELGVDIYLNGEDRITVFQGSILKLSEKQFVVRQLVLGKGVKPGFICVDPV